jgi:hypothetical protein
MREVVAKPIMELAQRGERDRETLVEDALHFVIANYEGTEKLRRSQPYQRYPRRDRPSAGRSRRGSYLIMPSALRASILAGASGHRSVPPIDVEWFELLPPWEDTDAGINI